MTGYPETLLLTKKYKCKQTIRTEIQYIQNNNGTPKCHAGSYIYIYIYIYTHTHTLVIKPNYGFIKV